MEGTIEINGVKYRRCDEEAKEPEGMKYVIVRSPSAGVFAGWLKEQVGTAVTLINSRRLWYWKGAYFLSQVAEEGVKCPDECKFGMDVGQETVFDVCEILIAKKAAQESILAVKVCKK